MAHAIKQKSESVGYYRYFTDVILGKGNFATVYLSRHKVVGCEVALKVIDKDIIQEEYVLRNLPREAHILRDLHHPNIIRLYEAVKSRNLYCLALELIRGVNLFEYMMKQPCRRISENLARLFFYQMLSAVEYMHRLHVLHRDLKLENVLVENGYIMKIADFGLSNIYYPYSELRTHCGSVEYAAPELFRSSVYGAAVDIWSLGVILYAMVVGKMPFVFKRGKLESARTRQVFMQRISKGLIQENWELMEELSPDCWNFLHELLNPDQFKRIRVGNALLHHWITKDQSLKRRLPQKRKDLQRKFQPEVAEYLAHKLNTSRARIERHVSAHRNDKIASMFFMVRDILVKEVLHPPKPFENSFLYRFECWRGNRNSLFPIRQNFYEQSHFRKRERNENNSSKNLPESLPKVDNEFQLSSKDNPELKYSDDLKSISYSKRNSAVSTVTTPKKLVKQACYSTTEDLNLRYKKGHEVEQTECQKQRVSHSPYRSYKNSRPENVKSNLSMDTNNEKLPSIKCDVNRKPRLPHSLSFPKPHEKELLTNQNKTKSNWESDIAKNYSSTNQVEYSSTILTPKQYNSTTCMKSKFTTCKDEKKICTSNTPDNFNSSANDIPVLKNLDSLKGNIQTIKTILKNTNPRESSCKRTEEKGTSLLNRTQRPSNDLEENLKNLSLNAKTTPSRIPIKDMKYGPPASFSQPFQSSETKVKRPIAIDPVNLCRGDTNEEIV